MVRARVNEAEHDVSTEGLATIGDLLDQLGVYVPPRDIIVGVRINGTECDNEPASPARGLPVNGVTDVELQTRSPEAFAAEARGRLDSYLTRIQTKLERAIECFDRGLEGDGLECYRLAVQELSLLVTLWNQLNQLGAETLHPREAATADLQGICDHLWTAQDRNDFASIRAVLVERLLPFLERWRGAVQPDTA
jgi:hypothetical protein